MYYITFINNKNEKHILSLDIYEYNYKDVSIEDIFNIKEIICIEDIPTGQELITEILMDIINK